MRKQWSWMVAATVVLLIAAALRMIALGEVPPGLYHDEAYYALDALDVLRGRLALYFPANNGREPLFIYLLALSIGAFGRNPFAVRLTAAFVGVVTVAATMAMGRALFSRRIGLLAGATLAVTLWHVHLSRVGFRAGTLPLLIALTVWQAARGKRQEAGGKRHWAAAGALYGLTFYTYTAARFTPVALAAFALYLWAITRNRPEDTGATARVAPTGAGWAALTAALVIAPLGLYAALHPDVVLGRAGQVWLWNPAISRGDPWGTLVAHTLRTLGMFFVRGDRIWRHNLPWRPVFDPALGAAFVVGTIAALARARRDARAGFVLIWTAVMTLPTLLAEDAPHFLRAVGVLPVVTLLPAMGIEWANERIGEFTNVRIYEPSSVRIFVNSSIRPFVAGTVLLIGLIATVGAYFGDYARAPQAGYWFEHGAATLGVRVQDALAEERAVYIAPELWNEWQPQLDFLVPEIERAAVGLEGTPAARCAVFTWPYGDWRRAWALLPSPAELYIEPGPLSQGDLDPQPFITYIAFLAAPPAARAGAALARFSGGVELLSVDVEASSEKSEACARLTWRAAAPLGEDYTVFLHYLRDGQRIAQADSRPAGGYYPTSRWRPGDVIHDDHCAADVGAPAAGRDRLLIGFWQPETGAKLYLLDAAGNPAGDWVEIPVN